jgi:phage terminase small subunit
VAKTKWAVPPKSNRPRDIAQAQRIQRFVEEWVTCGSAAEAARRAGYHPNHARWAAGNLKRKHPHLPVEVARRRAALIKKIELNQESVIIELARLAFSNIAHAVTWQDGKPTIADSDAIDPDTLAAIQEISADAEGKMKIKMYDKRSALVDLGKFMGLSQPDGVAELLAKLAGVNGEADAPMLDRREAARRVALLLRNAREQKEREGR